MHSVWFDRYEDKYRVVEEEEFDLIDKDADDDFYPVIATSSIVAAQLYAKYRNGYMEDMTTEELQTLINSLILVHDISVMRHGL